MQSSFKVRDLKAIGALASTEHDGNFIASNVLDSNPQTGWAPWELPYVNNPSFRSEVPMDRRKISWVQIDLGEPHWITEVELVPRMDGGPDGENTRRHFEIRASDSEEMTEENSVLLGGQGETSITPRQPWICKVPPGKHGPYRYIRATKTKQDPYATPNDTAWDFFVSELKVRGE